MLRHIFIIFHTGFGPLNSHSNPTKSLHIEKNLFLTKKLRAIAITRNSRKSRNSFSGEFRVIVFRLYVKTILIGILLWQVDSYLEMKIPSSKLSFLCPIPKNDNSEFF